MCEPISITTALTAAGVAISAAGAAYSLSQQSAASESQRQANVVANNAQNTAFWSRNADERAQLQAQGEAQNKAITASSEAMSQQRQTQAEALKQRTDIINQENTQADQIRQAADAQQGQLLGQTTGTSLQDAQAADLSSRTQAMAPIAQNIQTASPLGDPGEGSPTKQAFASRLAEAAGAVRDYGERVAKVASYTAPLNTVQQAITQESTGLLPQAEANRLLQAGQGIRLLPSQTSYALAGSEGDARKQQIASALAGDLSVAQNRYDGSESATNLAQADATTLARNQATEATSNAAVGQSLGQLISTVGNLTAYGAQRFAPGTIGPSADALINSPVKQGGLILSKGTGTVPPSTGSFSVIR